jgi:hypothetical protein
MPATEADFCVGNCQGGERGFGVFMHADTSETIGAAHPLGQYSARRRVVVHNGNSDIHGLHFSLSATGKIVVSFHDMQPVKINKAMHHRSVKDQRQQTQTGM